MLLGWKCGNGGTGPITDCRSPTPSLTGWSPRFGVYGIEVLKWHASGDFYDAAYIRRVIEIVKRTPNTTHFAYTRSWDAAKRGHPELRPLLEELAVLDNFRLLYSADAEMFPQDVPPCIKVAYLVRGDAEKPTDDVFVVFRDSHQTRKKEIEDVAGRLASRPYAATNKIPPQKKCSASSVGVVLNLRRMEEI